MFSVVLKKIASRFGFEISRKINLHNNFNDHVNNVLFKYEIDCILDVGANAGQYGESLRKIGYQGWIVSFEPVKAVFEKLKECAENDDKWLCYNLALGEEVEEKNINVYGSTVFSSFLEATDYAKGIWNSLDIVVSETVSVVTLDEIFADIQNKTGAEKYYLKLDTQGYDINVFRGAKNMLNHVLAMQSEISYIHVYENMQSPYKVLEEFEEKGFAISGMYPINRDASMAVIEFDAVLVRVNIVEC